jgi:hypothetical protein
MMATEQPPDTEEQAERIMMRCVEQHVAPRRDVLKRLVKKCPPPQKWYDEPEWNDNERKP